MHRIRLELNLTLACNHACPSCNRLCHLFPARTGHMTLGQIAQLIGQVREAQGAGRARVKRLKVVGGEPLQNPEFLQIYGCLCGAVDAGLFDAVKIQSNGVQPIPAGLLSNPRVRFSGKSFAKREHLQLISPRDLPDCPPTTLGCMMLRRCGASLDAFGWLPCSAAIAIVGAFGLEHLYRDELPTEPWGLDELCGRCACSLPADVQRELTKPLSVDHEMSASWVRALRTWDGLARKARW